MDISNEDKIKLWEKYIKFIKDWAEEHSGFEHYMSSPPCYLEWFDNELFDGMVE